MREADAGGRCGKIGRRGEISRRGKIADAGIADAGIADAGFASHRCHKREVCVQART